MDLILIAGLGMASVLDWRFRKVPNGLTLPLILTGIVFRSVREGIPGLGESLLGFTVGIALLYLPFLLGGIGGGDVKLMGAIGAFVGPVAAVKVFLIGALVGAVLSLFEIARKKEWKSTLENLRNRIVHVLLTNRWAPESEIRFSPRPLRVPYALALSAGYGWLYLFGGG